MREPCKSSFEPELSAYIDGELPPARHAEVARHLGQCATCAGDLARLEGVSTVLRRWDATETRYATSHAFRNRVIDRIDGRSGAGSRPAVSPWLGRSAAAAAVLAAAVVGMVYGSRDVPATEDGRLEGVFAQRDRLRTELGSRTGIPASTEPGARATVRPWGEPIVADGDDPLPLSVDPSDDGARTYEYEQRGGMTVLREAVLPHEDFEREKRFFSVAEMVRGRLAPTTERPTEAGQPLPPLARFLSHASVGQGSFEPYKRVQVWPITIPASAADGAAALLAKDAIRTRVLEVRESEIKGMEDMILFSNQDAAHPVLVLAGDVFSGGKQDRVVQEDMLIPPGAALHVRTKTSGRRRARTSYRRFTNSPGIAPTRLRALLAAKGSQREFDRGVLQTVRELANPGGRGSLENLYGSNQLSNQTNAFLKRFDARLRDPDVIGFAVAAGSDLLGIELFGDHATFLALHDRVLTSYLHEALARDRLSDALPTAGDVESLLAAASRGVVPQDASIGAGRLGDVVDPATGAFGFGLLADTGLVHATIFPTRPGGFPPLGERGTRGGLERPEGTRPFGSPGTRDADDHRAGGTDGPGVGPR